MDARFGRRMCTRIVIVAARSRICWWRRWKRTKNWIVFEIVNCCRQLFFVPKSILKICFFIEFHNRRQRPNQFPIAFHKRRDSENAKIPGLDAGFWTRMPAHHFEWDGTGGAANGKHLCASVVVEQNRFGSVSGIVSVWFSWCCHTRGRQYGGTGNAVHSARIETISNARKQRRRGADFIRDFRRRLDDSVSVCDGDSEIGRGLSTKLDFENYFIHTYF